MDISVIGAGYVGLITAAGFAEKGHSVICVDIDEKKVASINKKKSPIYERGLNKILDTVVPKRLKASLNLKEAVMNTDVSFICVGTPSEEEGNIDLKCVEDVSKDVGGVLKDKSTYHLVVVKSTVIPGTTEETVIPILEKHSGKKAGKDFGVVMNPEFLREGMAIQDFMNPDRIVIGAIDGRSGDLLDSIYFDFTSPVLRTDLKTAEMIKYASNSLLAVKISFINEVGNMCKKMGIDVYDVAKGVGLDHRISPDFLRAGPGWGGSCFPKDVIALIRKAHELGIEPTLLQSALDVNKKQPQRFVDLVKSKVPLKGKRVAVLGLAFKAGTDDVRDSPAIQIVNALLKEGASVVGYDPKAMENAKKVLGDEIEYAKSIEDALQDADLALIVTDWEEFTKMDFSHMKTKMVFDSRKILNVDLLPDDVEYEGLCW